MKTIDNDIKLGQLKKAYLLYGQERYLIRQYREKLKNAIVSPDDTMNFTGFEGADINVKEIIDLAETMPFFAERRLILLEDSKLFKKGGDELGDYLARTADILFPTIYPYNKSKPAAKIPAPAKRHPHFLSKR